MKIQPEQIARMIDLSAVRTNSDDEAIRECVRIAREHHVYLVSVLPNQISRVKALLGEGSKIKIGGNVGFPSGGQTRTIKVAEAGELVSLGCDEIDMVPDLAGFLSGRTDETRDEIRDIVEICGERTVKVILETHYLNADQIRIACDLAIDAGAGFVKTSTGWAPTGATLETISLIKAHVGEKIQIKASGGIRSLQFLLDLYQAGARRFGISYRSGGSILRELPDE